MKKDLGKVTDYVRRNNLFYPINGDMTKDKPLNSMIQKTLKTSDKMLTEEEVGLRVGVRQVATETVSVARSAQKAQHVAFESLTQTQNDDCGRLLLYSFVIQIFSERCNSIATLKTVNVPKPLYDEGCF